jgi:hypothetical protein
VFSARPVQSGYKDKFSWEEWVEFGDTSPSREIELSGQLQISRQKGIMLWKEDFICDLKWQWGRYKSVARIGLLKTKNPQRYRCIACSSLWIVYGVNESSHPIQNHVSKSHTIPKSWQYYLPTYVLFFAVVSFLLDFPPKSYMHSSSSHAFHMPCPSHPLWLEHSNYTWRRAQVIKLLIVQFSRTSCHFISLLSKFSLQKHLSFVVLSECSGSSVTPFVHCGALFRQ